MSPDPWHPPATLLELAELVATGALRRMPDRSALREVPQLADALHLAPEPGPDGVLLEDPQGTPVARWFADGSVQQLRPFAHGPLRTRRRTPAELRGDLDALPIPPGGAPERPLALLLADPLPAGAWDGVLARARAARARLALIVLVGPARGPSGAPAARYRAAVRLAAAAEAAGVPALAVPVALPRTGVPALDDALERELLATLRLSPMPVPQAEELVGGAGAGRGPGVAVLLTGLSGSGKSTIASALAERLEEGGRTVTVLDGDEVRRLLSHGLGFTRADRDLNVRRIGYVAAEVARHGGVAVAAPIAPFDAVRREVRATVHAAGGDFVLVHVATPLEECERRDRKGLYARARRGEIPEFTGISSPYEVPDDAELVLDTTAADVGACVEQVWELLVRRGHVGDPPGGSAAPS